MSPKINKPTRWSPEQLKELLAKLKEEADV
jgi:hypothetical protein